MFEPNKNYKVKVELANGETGFGRVTVLGKDDNRLLMQLRTSKERNEVLPKGSKLFVINESAVKPFNGLWSTQVVGARIVNGKTVMECSAPKFQAMEQRRATARFALSCPVLVTSAVHGVVPYEVRLCDISVSGIGLETSHKGVPEFPVDQVVRVRIEAGSTDIDMDCKVVRTQYNWLHNRNVIGLEIESMEAAEAQKLRSLLEHLSGGKSLEPGTVVDASETGSLSKWMRSTKDNMSFVKPHPVADSSAENSAGAQLAGDEQKEDI